MRTIKFRAWNGKKMGIPFFPLKAMSTYNPEQDVYNRFPSDTVFMQFTGLHDKNGKEIYEGDVVKMYHKLPSVSDYYSNEKVYWVDTHYMLGDAPLHSGLFQHGDNLEVIGNIYENPELLKP